MFIQQLYLESSGIALFKHPDPEEFTSDIHVHACEPIKVLAYNVFHVKPP